MVIKLQETDKKNDKPIEDLTLQDFDIPYYEILRASRISYQEGKITHVFKDRNGRHGLFEDNDEH